MKVQHEKPFGLETVSILPWWWVRERTQVIKLVQSQK